MKAFKGRCVQSRQAGDRVTVWVTKLLINLIKGKAQNKESGPIHRNCRKCVSLIFLSSSFRKDSGMKRECRIVIMAIAVLFVALALITGPTFAQDKKPNILFIMGDDIGWMQPGIYHRGLMVGETPNIDRIGSEGAIFMDYVAMQSCTSGRNAFFTGMYPSAPA